MVEISKRAAPHYVHVPHPVCLLPFKSPTFMVHHAYIRVLDRSGVYDASAFSTASFCALPSYPPSHVCFVGLRCPLSMTSIRKNTQKADADLASAAATLVDLSAAACPVSYPPSPLALPSPALATCPANPSPPALPPSPSPPSSPHLPSPPLQSKPAPAPIIHAATLNSTAKPATAAYTAESRVLVKLGHSLLLYSCSHTHKVLIAGS